MEHELSVLFPSHREIVKRRRARREDKNPYQRGDPFLGATLPMLPSDESALWDVVECCRRIVAMTSSVAEDDFGRDSLLYDAVQWTVSASSAKP